MIKVCTSGYYNPVHVGHIECFAKAKALGDWLVVIVNNDAQVLLKGSKKFMDENERCAIIKAIKYVDEVVLSIDTDKTICKTLEMIKPTIFAKGGDSTPQNVPEKDVCERIGCQIIYGLGDKIQSSSWLKSQ